MLWGDRPDGVRVRDLPPMRVLMPHLIPRRNSAVVYLTQRLDLTQTVPWLEQRSAEAGVRITLFHLLQFALVQVLVQRPLLHRFVAGRCIYQRRHLELSFAVKKRLDDGAGMTAVKVRLAPDADLLAVVRAADGGIAQGRGRALLPSEREMQVFGRLPPFLLGWLVALQRQLDAWNLLPGALTASDPLYCSAFLANLGSIGLQAPIHHLFDWGTSPIFGALGAIHQAAWVNESGGLEVRPTVEVSWSYDERIADGLYCAKSMEILRKVVERPDLSA
ncbi:MAG: 2-oxo acid dehydrogenase subunit E2 [Deltaproteobacteria bacterium]|nr:2-oxo acid dehydrogenase subunit E2 [Deltaproteobacteria bacterium]